MRILSNIPELDRLPPAGPGVVHHLLRDTRRPLSAFGVFRQSLGYDLLLLDGNPPYLWLLCLLRWFWPFGAARLVSLDIMFVTPRTGRQRLTALGKRFLMKRVDHFIH